MKRWFAAFWLLLFLSALTFAQSGVKKIRPPPRNFGKVVLDNFSEKAKLAPVGFDHWVHRSKFTCRLCHVDLGFAMMANATGITATDNMNGDYCGACHNGKTRYDGQKIFPACAQQPVTMEQQPSCERCHSQGKAVIPSEDFATFVANFPKKRFGNGIDWIEGESMGLIKLVDNLDGVSSKRKSFKNPDDSTITPKVKGMPDIIFSHEKHGVWNGCELCHPEVFPSVEKSKAAAYSMNEIFDGKYCGACHGKVAFPMVECARCHSKPVETH